MTKEVLLREFVQAAVRTLPFSAAPQLAERLSTYTQLLYAANKHVNLFSRQQQDMETIFLEHIYDSLLGAAVVRAQLAKVKAGAGGRVKCPVIMDLGSGAGLPGIPLACLLAASSCEFLLVESNGKRAQFLNTALQTLALPHVRVLHANAAEVKLPIAFVVTRAVAALAKLYRLTKTLRQAAAGREAARAAPLLAYKGKVTTVQRELEELRPLLKRRSGQLKLHPLTPAAAAAAAAAKLQAVPGDVVRLSNNISQEAVSATQAKLAAFAAKERLLVVVKW